MIVVLVVATKTVAQIGPISRSRRCLYPMLEVSNSTALRPRTENKDLQICGHTDRLGIEAPHAKEHFGISVSLLEVVISSKWASLLFMFADSNHSVSSNLSPHTY